MNAREPWLAPSEHPALHHAAGSESAARLAARADALAAWLGDRGVARGDVVAAHLPNAVGFVALLHALDRIDAILLPLNRRHTATELRRTCADARPKLVLHDPKDGNLPGDLPDWVALPELPCDASARAPAGDLDTPALLLFTSGTTGRAKGALLTHAKLRAAVAASSAHLGERPDDHWLACLPLFHIGGLAILLRCAAGGLPLTLHPDFDPERVASALSDEAITHVSLVPTMLTRLLATAGRSRAPKGLRMALLGGAGAAPALLEEAARAGWPVAATYGLTEAASQVATRLPDESIDAPLTPLPGVDLRVVDDAGQDAAPDTVGEILVRGDNVIDGYWSPGGIDRSAVRAGWLATGDLGSLDAAGRLRVVDRRADLIVSGGENVYPAEVETVLSSHPDVAAAAVVALPDAEFGQRVAAFVVAADGTKPDPETLRAFCREHLAGYKTPARVRVVQALPTTAAGKIQRHRLREWIAEETR